MHSAHRSRVTLLRYRPDIFETFQSIFNFSLLLQQVWTQLSQLEFLNGHWTCGKICIFDSSIVVTVKLYGRTEDKHFFEKFQLIFLKIRIISCFTKVNVHFENTFSPPSVYILLRVKIIVNKRRINLHYISIIMTSIRVYAISRYSVSSQSFGTSSMKVYQSFEQLQRRDPNLALNYKVAVSTISRDLHPLIN